MAVQSNKNFALFIVKHSRFLISFIEFDSAISLNFSYNEKDIIISSSLFAIFLIYLQISWIIQIEFPYYFSISNCWSSSYFASSFSRYIETSYCGVSSSSAFSYLFSVILNAFCRYSTIQSIIFLAFAEINYEKLFITSSFFTSNISFLTNITK